VGPAARDRDGNDARPSSRYVSRRHRVRRLPVGDRPLCDSTDVERSDHRRDPKTNKRHQIKRGGFATKTEAENALAELVDQTSKGTATNDERQTVRAFLGVWIEEKERNGLRPTTLKSYRQHIDQYIVPTIGSVRLRDLRPTHVEQMLATVAKPVLGRRSVGPASVRRVHATLRSALGTAKRRRLISFNPAIDVELPTAGRPKVRPWEPADLGTFLDAVARDPMASLFETIAASGTRRGECLGLRWADVDLVKGRAVVREQLLQLDGDQPPCGYCGQRHRGAVFGPVKTSSGEDRIIDLDAGVVGVLMEHRLRQDLEREAWGSAYSDHGLVFAREDGTPIPPERVSKRFKKLLREHGLRDIRPHDLRHGRASLLLASGTDIALVSKLMGHSSISLTSDTYSHLLEGVGRAAAERASALVPRKRRGDRPDDSCDQSVTNGASESSQDPRQIDEGPESIGAPPGTRTPNPLIKSQLLCQLS
jgi:integrase